MARNHTAFDRLRLTLVGGLSKTRTVSVTLSLSKGDVTARFAVEALPTIRDRTLRVAPGLALG